MELDVTNMEIYRVLTMICIGLLVVAIIVMFTRLREEKAGNKGKVTQLENENKGLRMKVDYMRERLPMGVQEKLELARFKQELEDLKKKYGESDNNDNNSNINNDFSIMSKIDNTKDIALENINNFKEESIDSIKRTIEEVNTCRGKKGNNKESKGNSIEDSTNASIKNNIFDSGDVHE